MTVYTDGTHIMGTDDEELHKVAHKLGFSRYWYKEHPRHPHYDITTESRRKYVLSSGKVQLVSSKELLRLCRR